MWAQIVVTLIIAMVIIVLIFREPISQLIMSVTSNKTQPQEALSTDEPTAPAGESTDESIADGPTLVFGIEAPNREDAARAANYRGPLVRDVASSIPTRIVGNSNSSYGTIIRMAYENKGDMNPLPPADSPMFIFNSSTHYEDACRGTDPI